MIDIWVNIISFVTGFVSFLYGTRICWGCGKACEFTLEPHFKKYKLKYGLPAATALFVFGFMLIFSHSRLSSIDVYIYSVVSAVLSSHYIINATMPKYGSFIKKCCH